MTDTSIGPQEHEQPRRQDEIFRLMRTLIRKHPESSQKAMRVWRDTVRDDPDLMDDAMELVAVYVYNASLPKQKLTRRTEKTEEQTRDEVKRLILDLFMPNGKRLGDCTFKDIAAFGKGFQRLAKMGDPDDIVRNKLNDDQVRKALEG